jgi:hypothetical protein
LGPAPAPPPDPCLSRIAKAVTGTSWNGFLWLGLDKRKRGKKEATA